MNSSNETGAAVTYTRQDRRGGEVIAYLGRIGGQRFRANVVERVVNGRSEFAAVFPRLPLGDYIFCGPKDEMAEITVFPGETAEIDWR